MTAWAAFRRLVVPSGTPAIREALGFAQLTASLRVAQLATNLRVAQLTAGLRVAQLAASLRFALMASLLVFLALPAVAHKPSDSYLTLRGEADGIAVRWDIALRDLD